MNPGYEQIIHSCFDAIRARDAEALVRLFSRDAELVTAAGTFRGRDEIAGFYRDLVFVVEDLWPEPGPLSIAGDEVTVEIQLRMNGDTSRVNDLFTLRGEWITRLAIEPDAPETEAGIRRSLRAGSRPGRLPPPNLTTHQIPKGVASV